MFKVNIYKNSIVTNEASFQSEDLANNWLMQESLNGSFGKNERWLIESEFTNETVEQSLEWQWRDGFDDLPEYKFPADYSVEIIDISAEVLAQQESIDALAYLSNTDWYIIREMDTGEPCPNDIKLARVLARSKVVHE